MLLKRATLHDIDTIAAVKTDTIDILAILTDNIF